MGTRNLTIVKSKGKVKVAQYCQWDGYPTGQGETISNFLRDKKNIEKLNTEIQTVEFISHEEENKLWHGLGADDSGLVNMEVSDKFKEKYPELHRDTGAKVLSLIATGKAKKVANEIDFLKDKLFCEYAYEIELDKKTVAVYVGGKKYKTYKFSDFAKKTAMKKLEKELKGE